jgi:hypothetical protein
MPSGPQHPQALARAAQRTLVDNAELIKVVKRIVRSKKFAQDLEDAVRSGDKTAVRRLARESGVHGTVTVTKLKRDPALCVCYRGVCVCLIWQ